MPLPALPIPLPTAARRWLRENRFLVVFAVLASVMGTSVGTAKIVTSLYALHLGASGGQLGLIAAGQVAGTLVMSLPVGVLVDTVGPRRLFLLGSLLAGITYALVPLLASPAFLLGCVTAVGVFMPLRFVSLNTVFFEQIRHLGEHKAGWYRGTHMTGMHLVGPGVAVALVASAGYAGTWWLISASFAVTIALSPLVFGRYAPARAGRPRPGWRQVRADLAAVWRDAELRQVNLIDVCSQATNAFHTTFVVAVALQVFHLPPSGAAAFVTGHGVAFIATLFAGGAFVRRAGPQAACVAGFALAASALAGVALAPAARWLWPAVLGLGVALGLLQTVTLSRIAGIGARLGQGKVSGLNLFVSPFGALVGTVAGGLAGDRIGLQAAYLLFVAPFLLLAAWTWRAAPLSRLPARVPLASTRTTASGTVDAPPTAGPVQPHPPATTLTPAP